MVTPRVFTIPSSVPFLPTLIRALTQGELVAGFPSGHDPLALADATLYLPTRRACRSAQDFFLDATTRNAAILPRIVPLGDVDEDQIAFAQAATGKLAATELDLPPAIGELERRLLLARLVRQWGAGIASERAGEPLIVADNPLSAFALAGDLARLIDDMTTRHVPWGRLDELVPENLDRYWQLTLEFLKIARNAWPEILSERGSMEATARRDALLKAEAARLGTLCEQVVIAAGSTGSMPATAELIATIAKLPHGAVVLPGLDTELDEESWAIIGAGEQGGDADKSAHSAVSHPQLAMHSLLQRIGIARDEVAILGARVPHARERYLSEALRPAARTQCWQRLVRSEVLPPATMNSIAVIEAANAEEEALAISVVLREAVEQEKTAALITPDRALARRVLAALERWNLEADDSGGDSVLATPTGRFACLVAEAALGGVPPVGLLALLKHPLLRLGLAPDRVALGIGALERAVLRGPRPRAGTAGLAHALAAFCNELAKLRQLQPSALHRLDPRSELPDRHLDIAAEICALLSSALAPLEQLAPDPQPFRELAARHATVIAALSGAAMDQCLAFLGQDGVKLHEFFEEIAGAAADANLDIFPQEYPELFKAAISDRVVRWPPLANARVRIYGPLEARLQSADRIVLGGLVEGVWPPEARPDPWLSRPMRHALGLDLPERRISLSAHDFAQAMGAAEVVLAYPTRLAGVPTVASRFVQRLAAVAGESGWSSMRADGTKYLAWARALDRPEKSKRIDRPAPKPPRAARPTALSVTDIESWLRDPYSIYARYVLRLRELDPVDSPLGAADRGIVIHAALSEFSRKFAERLPADPTGALIEIGKRHFESLADYPEAQALWWPRFLRIAHWFAGWEAQRRSVIAAIKAEISGEIEIPLAQRVFTLRARADRIEQLSGGACAILDYKTGQVPTEKQVRVGISPQLTLEAAILRRGGFPGFAAGASVAELVYVSLRGGEIAGEGKQIGFKDGDADSNAERALQKLCAVVERFEDEQQPYLPLVLSMWKNRYGSYDHLSRVLEWSTGQDDDSTGGDA
jgi:ATP-dependent helicase/nuclease subunit B